MPESDCPGSFQLPLAWAYNLTGDFCHFFCLDKRHFITAGNAHLRRLLVEAAQCYTRGRIGQKSKALIARQRGNTPQVIAYADKANERLRRRYYRLSSHTKRNIAVTAVARELACFIWGMMTNNIASVCG